MLEYNFVAKRQHAHGSSARCKDAEITLDTDVKGRLPETTPVLEASALQDDLRRARIEPFAWVIKGGVAAAQPRNLLLQARAAAEIRQIRKVKELLAKRLVLIPFQTDERRWRRAPELSCGGVATHGAVPGLTVNLRS